jgi:hypothetical protein
VIRNIRPEAVLCPGFSYACPGSDSERLVAVAAESRFLRGRYRQRTTPKHLISNENLKILIIQLFIFG